MHTENFVHIQQKLYEIYFKQNLLPLSKIYTIEGVKPVSRVVTNESHFETLQNLFEPMMNVHIERSPFKLLIQARSNTSGVLLAQVDADNPYAENIYVYISRDQEKMDALIQLDALEKDPYQQTGHLLGYPKCCMDNYYKSIIGAADRLYVEFENTPIQKSYYFYNNRICSLFRQHSLISDMYPCSFACPNSAKLAKALLQEFAQIVRNNNNILFAADKLQFYRDHISTEEIPIKKESTDRRRGSIIHL